MRLARPGGGRDRLSLKGRIPVTLVQLGLPGQNVTISLTNGGAPFFSVTVPAASFTPNGNGTKLGFRGTIGGAVVKLRLGGRTRTDVSLSARNLNLGGAAAGPFTGTIGIGPLELSAGGTLRALGAKLLYP